MLEPLFESKIKENILLYLFINSISYPSELSRNFNLNLFAVQNQLKKLESGGGPLQSIKRECKVIWHQLPVSFQKRTGSIIG
jgi:predicted transcriptional regulator